MDPALLPAYSYAESSPIRLVDPGGDAPDASGADLRASAVASAAVTAAAADRARSSRLWQALVRFSGSAKAKKLQAFSERFDAKPLIQINLTRTADGLALQNVKLSPFGFVQGKVFRGAVDRVGDAGTDPAADPGLGGKPAPTAGSGTAAVDPGLASVAAGSTAADTAVSSTGAGASTSPSSSAAGGAASSGGLSGSSSLSSSGSSGSSAVGAASGPPQSGGN